MGGWNFRSQWKNIKFRNSESICEQGVKHLKINVEKAHLLFDLCIRNMNLLFYCYDVGA